MLTFSHTHAPHTRTHAHTHTPTHPHIHTHTGDLPEGDLFLAAVISLKRATTPEEAVPLIAEFGLDREHVPSQLLKYPEVWAALLPHMPAVALLRNLNKMTQVCVCVCVCV